MVTYNEQLMYENKPYLDIEHKKKSAVLMADNHIKFLRLQIVNFQK